MTGGSSKLECVHNRVLARYGLRLGDTVDHTIAGGRVARDLEEADTRQTTAQASAAVGHRDLDTIPAIS